MKPQELRIGNTVEFINNIISVSEGTFRSMGINPFKYEPIPLTEEWLLKFGFNGLTVMSLDIKNGDELLCIPGKNRTTTQLHSSYLHDDDTLEHTYRNLNIEHIHQLQNLYFALTGEELTIKE